MVAIAQDPLLDDEAYKVKPEPVEDVFMCDEIGADDGGADIKDENVKDRS